MTADDNDNDDQGRVRFECQHCGWALPSDEPKKRDENSRLLERGVLISLGFLRK